MKALKALVVVNFGVATAGIVAGVSTLPQQTQGEPATIVIPSECTAPPYPCDLRLPSPPPDNLRFEPKNKATPAPSSKPTEGDGHG